MDGASMARNWHFRRWTDPPLKRRSPALVGTSNRAGFIGIGSGQTHIVTARAGLFRPVITFATPLARNEFSAAVVEAVAAAFPEAWL